MIKTGLLWSAAFIAAMLAISVYGWTAIPDGAEIARHWDINGNPNGFSSKMEILLMTPGIAVFVSAVLAIVPLIFPRRENLERSSAFYLTGWIGAMALVTVVHFTIVHGGATGAEPQIGLVMAVTGAFIAVMGNFMAKSKSNWVAGLRNPWTLTSEHAWTVGNRLCGYLFVLTGLAVIVAAFWQGMAAATWVLMVGIFGAVIVASIASYFAWRHDPEARSRS